MPTQLEMQRELHAYAMEEMRNRGLEAAAAILERHGRKYGYRTNEVAIGTSEAARLIRDLKRDPSQHLSDWWSDEQKSQVAVEPEPGTKPAEFFAGLTEEQQRKALEYRGDENHGDPDGPKRDNPQ